MVGIANYVFDTLRHDAYAVRGGELLETHVALPDHRAPCPRASPSTDIDLADGAVRAGPG